MFICDKCGNELDELPTFQDPRPYGNTTVYEEMTEDRCTCGGTYEEAETCRGCGEHFIELNSGLCDERVKDAYTAEIGLRYVEYNKSDFLEYFYGLPSGQTSNDADGILFRHFVAMVSVHAPFGRDCAETIKMKDYCLEDIENFAEFLDSERVTK